jgi:type VI secretion system protein ImpA
VSPLDATTLHDLSDASPAGENLELDPEFGALERAAQGKPETQYGDVINAATPPDWKETEANAVALLERTRDLRVLAHLAVARLHLAGPLAYAQVLAQIRSQIENRWEQVHPHLDPEDDNDPTLRSNALFRLQDPANVLRPLRDLPLASTPQTGPVSWRDIATFRGQVEPEPGREKRTEAFIRAAFGKSDPEKHQLLRDGIDMALEEATAIPSAFEAKAGAGSGPDFTNLVKLLAGMQKELREFEPAAAAESAEQTFEQGEAQDANAQAAKQQAAPMGFASVRSIDSIASRDDALYLLELAANYFRSYEPSSPLPLLIDRARRLAAMDFMDILRDLAPEGVGQAEIVVLGPPPPAAEQ